MLPIGLMRFHQVFIDDEIHSFGYLFGIEPSDDIPRFFSFIHDGDNFFGGNHRVLLNQP